METLLPYQDHYNLHHEQNKYKELTEYIYRNLDNLAKDNNVLNVINLFILDKETLPKPKQNEINSTLITFINSLNSTNIIPTYSLVYFVKKTKAFWDLLYKFRKINVLNKINLGNLLNKFPRTAFELTLYKDFYLSNKSIINDALIRNITSFEYFAPLIFEPENCSKSYIDNDIINQLAYNYLKPCPKGHRYLNIVESIAHPTPGTITFSDKVRVKAINKIDSFPKNPFSGSSRHIEPIFCNFKKDLNITYLKTDKYDHLCFKISRFEVSNHQFPFIRFLYIDTDSLRFHEGPEGIFVDLISIVNLLRTIGVDFREEFSFRDIKRTQKYSNAILSNIEKIQPIITIKKYEEILSENNVSAESAIEWYYTKYIKSYFNINNFEYIKSEPKSMYYHKCIQLCVELEKVFRQFRAFVEQKHICHKYLSNESSPVDYQKIPSIIPKKYCFLNINKYHSRSNTTSTKDQLRQFLSFFIEYSQLAYHIPENQKENGYFEHLSLDAILTNFNLKLEDIPDKYKNDIENCLNYGFIFKDNSGFIRPKTDVLNILKNKGVFINHDVYIDYYKCSDIEKKTIDQLIDNNSFLVSESLLNNNEQMYFDYILKKNLFTDGLNLRNKYLHGMSFQDSKQNKIDYLCLLSTMILLTFKIDEEFKHYFPQEH